MDDNAPPTSSLPMWMWGVTHKSQVRQMQRFVDTASTGLGRELSTTELNVTREFFTKKNNREANLHWIGGFIGMGATFRRALQQGWTLPMLTTPNAPQLPYVPGRFSLLGFPEVLIKSPRICIWTRSLLAFNIYGSIIGIVALPLIVPALNNVSQPDVLKDMFKSIAGKAAERAQQGQQSQRAPPPQVQTVADNPTDDMFGTQAQPDTPQSRWDQLRQKKQSKMEKSPAADRREGYAYDPYTEAAKKDRSEAQREFDAQLERERRGED